MPGIRNGTVIDMVELTRRIADVLWRIIGIIGTLDLPAEQPGGTPPTPPQAPGASANAAIVASGAPGALGAALPVVNLGARVQEPASPAAPAAPAAPAQDNDEDDALPGPSEAEDVVRARGVSVPRWAQRRRLALRTARLQRRASNSSEDDTDMGPPQLGGHPRMSRGAQTARRPARFGRRRMTQDPMTLGEDGPPPSKRSDCDK
ncbi:neurogenic differentiation factor 2-like [Ischnura elegans]|uniref:neurogenic differentiation factor 2-like n=1 Tax=Ischnura elegans TaxID=197161 RepID=UPI001ED8B590|nr:neurogenic differentiation factor 2-like [Ischnura elegans]